jgi:hypothetical protein
MEQEKIPHPFPLAPSTAKGIPRLRHGARWASGVHLALCGACGGEAAAAAFVGGGARRPGPERQLGVLRPPAFGLWPEARPRVFPGWQTAPGGREVAVWPCAAAAEAGVKSLQRPHGLVTCAIYPCALAGPGQGQGYAGARVRVTFSRIGTAARSLDPVLLHPGFWERGSILQKKRHTFF